MENVNELKKAILFAEKQTHTMEQIIAKIMFPEHRKEHEAYAGYMRIAAACMWEKLERLEATEEKRNAR